MVDVEVTGGAREEARRACRGDGERAPGWSHALLVALQDRAPASVRLLEAIAICGLELAAGARAGRRRPAKTGARSA